MKTALTVIVAIILALLLSTPSAKAAAQQSAKASTVTKAKVKKAKQVRQAVRRAASRRTVRAAARVTPPKAPARAAVQIGDTTPIRPTEIKTVSIPNRFNDTFDALDNFATRFNAVHNHTRRLKAMSDTVVEQDIERAVAEAVRPELEAADKLYPIEGINLGPAFAAIVEKLQPLRDALLKMISSTTNRDFAKQRALLVEFQSLVRAFDVLAGFVSPDGHQLSPMVEPDPEQAKRREEHIAESVERSAATMNMRAHHFANVPLEPPMRRGPTGFEPRQAIEPTPGWLGRRRA